MKKFRKIKIPLFILFVLVTFIIFSSSVVWANDSKKTPSIFERMSGGVNSAVKEAYGGGQEIKVGMFTFSAAVIKLINYALSFVGIIFLGLLIYAGYLWMTAQGNEEQVNKAKKIAREVVIALIIIITARILTEFLLTVFGQAAPAPEYYQ